MKNESMAPVRLLAVWPSTSGFSYAVIEGPTRLVDWKHKTAKGDINARCLSILKKLFGHLSPSLLILEDPSDPKGNRGPRVKKLLGEMIELAGTEKLEVHVVLREDVHKTLLGSPKGTKHEVAKKIAEFFPEELGAHLPPKRELWKNEHYHMATFEAVGLALTAFHLRLSTPATK